MPNPIYNQKMRVRARRACFLLHKDKITQMSPIDGPISLISEINLPHTSNFNISKAQPSKADGLGVVALPAFLILLYSYLDR